MDWQLISDILSHFHNHAYLLAPLGEELFPFGFAPDISRSTLASALREGFIRIFTPTTNGGSGELRYLDIQLNRLALCL